jgi:hypothetical protein
MHLTLQSVSDLKKAHSWFLAENEKATQESLKEAANKVHATVASTPVFTPRTGNLQNRTRTRVVKTSSGRLLKITNDAKYARSIESGSKAHWIVARRAKYLSFVGRDGARVFRKRVWHPGTKAYRFLENATAQGAHRFESEMSTKMSRISSNFSARR